MHIKDVLNIHLFNFLHIFIRLVALDAPRFWHLLCCCHANGSSPVFKPGFWLSTPALIAGRRKKYQPLPRHILLRGLKTLECSIRGGCRPSTTAVPHPVAPPASMSRPLYSFQRQRHFYPRIASMYHGRWAYYFETCLAIKRHLQERGSKGRKGKRR